MHSEIFERRTSRSVLYIRLLPEFRWMRIHYKKSVCMHYFPVDFTDLDLG